MKNFLHNAVALFFLCLFVTEGSSQNLVLNSDFETINTGCALSGYGSMTNWYLVDTCSSPDRFSTCFLFQALMGAPANGQGNQSPHSGTAYAGFISYDQSSGSTSYREYAGGTLSTPLTAGQTYCFSFYISLADNSPIAVNRLGVYFSNTQVFNNLHANDCIGTSTTLPYTPQLQWPSTISDKTNWVLVKWDYVATGGERYFVIGNFYNNANTTTTSAGGGTQPFSYYYIDDVSMVPGPCNTQAMSASASATNPNCANQCTGTATANASNSSGTVSYLWSNNATTQSISGLCAGSYTVTVTDASGTATASVSITTPSAPTLTPTANPTTCGASNGSASVSVSGGIATSYSWSNGSTSSTASGLSAGTYTVTVTMLGGCTFTSSATVTSSSGITLGTSTTGAGCTSNGSATVNVGSGTGPFSYLWSNGNNTQTAANLAAGTYTVTVTGSNSCSATASATVTSTGTGLVITPSSTSATCGSNNGSASVSVSGGTATGYTWSNNTTSATASNLAAGTYTVTVTGSGGCSATASVVVSATGAPTVTTSSTDAVCGTPNGSATVNVTSGTATAYAWSNGATTATASNLAEGTYTITVTGAGGCTVTASATVNAANSIVINALSTNTSCGNNNGTASVTVTSGTASSYQWSNNATTPTLNNLAAGTYTVTVTDAGGCTATASILVGGSGVNNVSITSDKNIMCSGDSAQVCAPAGYTAYQWNTGATTQCVYTKLAGNYYVTVTDAGSCTATSNHLAINVHPLPPVSISVNGDSLLAYNSVSYQWYLNGAPITGATEALYIATQTGNYTVVVTDVNGCTAQSLPVTITITGISSPEKEIFSIYPNPSNNGNWTLDVDNSWLNGECEVFDAEGRLVFKYDIKSAKSEFNLTVAKGVYVMRLVSGNRIVTQKLIKI